LITDVEIRDGRWYANDHLLTRGQKATTIAGGIRISLRGKEWLITEVRTGGAGDSRWFGGGLRFTATEQKLLTNVARTILQNSRKATGNYRCRT